MPYKDPERQKQYKKNYYLKQKYNIEYKLDSIKYPPITIPDNIKETKYPGYYISTEGNAYRSPGKRDTIQFINEYGLIDLNPALRGNPRHKKYQYPCINVSIKNEDGKFLKQVKIYIHRLVAETFIPNPNNLPEIDHIDRDKHNNHISNLRWVDRYENMESVAMSFIIEDTKTGEIYTGKNVAKWVRENWSWISLRTKMSQKKFIQDFTVKKKYGSLILSKTNNS